MGLEDESRLPLMLLHQRPLFVIMLDAIYARMKSELLTLPRAAR